MGSRRALRPDELYDPDDSRWMDDAACAGMDPDVFFPERGGSQQPAKAMCAVCPVRAECLEYALTFKIKHGTWGGMSERERRGLRRQRAQGAA